MPEASGPWRLDDTDFARPGERVGADWLVKRLSRASPEIRSHIALGGLLVGDAAEHAPLYAAAAAAIDEVSGLADIVKARVRHVHLLQAPPEYDISHSEPCWPDRIFVFVPDRSDDVGALRLAENVIHEAMHLHLTLFEDGTPLVRDPAGDTYSPWRRAFRPVGGVLHGLFVFACLREYFARLPVAPESVAADHVRRRLHEIDGEIAQIDFDLLLAALSDAGVTLVTACRRVDNCEGT
jgi:HEXXH motif-containing protein